MSKSEKIRQLFDSGVTVAEIAKVMGIRYQFAYNVISYYVSQKEMEAKRYVAAGLSTDCGIRPPIDHTIQTAGL